VSPHQARKRAELLNTQTIAGEDVQKEHRRDWLAKAAQVAEILWILRKDEHISLFTISLSCRCSSLPSTWV
jgi:hypothetical protein